MAKSKVKTAVARAGTKPKSVTAKKPAARVAKASKASAVKAVKPAKVAPAKARKAVKTVTKTVSKAVTKTPTTAAAKAAKPVTMKNPENPPVAAKAVSIAPAPAVAKESAPRLPLTLPKREADQPKVQSKTEAPDQVAASAAASPPSVIKPAPKPVPAHGKQQPRADIAPATGFTLVVDGHFKNQYDDAKAAKSAGTELLGKFPMLRVEIYDAAHKTRTPV